MEIYVLLVRKAGALIVAGTYKSRHSAITEGASQYFDSEMFVVPSVMALMMEHNAYLIQQSILKGE